MYDLLLRGGEAVLEGRGVVACDIAVQGGRIAALLSPGGPAEASEAFDARGLTIFPGVIDAHVHFGLGSSEDWSTESVAAAHGGVTTVLNYIQHSGSYFASLPEEIRRAEAASVIDFGIHGILMNDLHIAEAPRYVRELGMSSFKYFTNFKGQEGDYLGVQGTDAGFFLELCEELGRLPEAVLAVHTENIEVVWRLAARLKEQGRDGLTAWSDSRPDLVEAHDMYTAFLFAERTGCQVYIPHLSSAAGLAVHAEHVARGGRSYLETCPHYLTHTNQSELGSLAKVNPPLRSEADIEALWAAIAGGRIQVVGSDHNSRPRARKEGSIWKASAGFPGVSTLLPVLLSEGHARRGLPLERISQLVSSAPARIFGLYPRKGALTVGSDADFTLVDLNVTRAFDHAAVGSHADYSIYDGWRLKGWPTAAFVRGQAVMRDGQIVATPGFGRFLARPIKQTVSSGAAAS